MPFKPKPHYQSSGEDTNLGYEIHEINKTQKYHKMINEQRENEVKDLTAERDRVHKLVRLVIEPSQNVKPRYPQHKTNREL